MPHDLSTDLASTPLPAILDQRTAEATRDVLLAALARGDVALDGSGVERVNTVGVQLILSAAKTAADQSVAFHIDRPSQAFHDTLHSLGLESHFADWIRP